MRTRDTEIAATVHFAATELVNERDDVPVRMSSDTPDRRQVEVSASSELDARAMFAEHSAPRGSMPRSSRPSADQRLPR
jgi:hypothetical protein